jgi:hypothetical protein
LGHDPEVVVPASHSSPKIGVLSCISIDYVASGEDDLVILHHVAHESKTRREVGNTSGNDTSADPDSSNLGAKRTSTMKVKLFIDLIPRLTRRDEDGVIFLHISRPWKMEKINHDPLFDCGRSPWCVATENVRHCSRRSV